jgi:hypothetical protein
METSEGCHMGYKYGKTPITGQVSDYLGQIRPVKVDGTKLEAFWGALVDEYHYLEYYLQFGGRVKYLIVIGRQPVCAIGFCSAAYKLGPRDQYLGWDEAEPFMVEIFVDRQRYNGTCYKAANWTYLGITKGYGKQGNTFVYHGQKKDIYVKIMNRRFASQLKPSLNRLHQSIREEILAMAGGVPMWYPSVLGRDGHNNLKP